MMCDMSAYVSCYSQAGIYSRMGDVLEAIFERRGSFAQVPPSSFEAFQTKACEIDGLDYRRERRRFFEAFVAGRPSLGPRRNASDEKVYRHWSRAFNQTRPPFSGSSGNLRPQQVRTLLNKLVREKFIPEGAEVCVDEGGYSWKVKTQEGEWQFILGGRGHFSRGGFNAFPIEFVVKPDPREVHVFHVNDAFLEMGSPPATHEEFEAWHRRHAVKVKAVLDYLEATAGGGS